MRKFLIRLLLILIIASVIPSVASCDVIEELFGVDRHACVYSEDSVISPIGCTSDGIIIKQCICGRETTEITPAKGHSFGEWVTTEEADCTSSGRQERICPECMAVEYGDIPKESHDYEIVGEQVGETMYNRYTCLDCGESFSVASGITIPEEEDGSMLIPEVEVDFSFVIISAGDGEYIRNYLKIYELASYPQTEIEYTLTELGEGRWQVSSEAFLKGKSYIAERDGGIFFADYGNRSLIFTIIDEESLTVDLSDEIIYLADLEEKSPGYYPYNIEFSDGSGGFFLTLEKTDGLDIGDVICVGNARNEEEVIAGVYENTFGQIKSITSLSDGRNLIMLGTENLSQLFEKMEVYSDSLIAANPYHPNASFEAKILARLLGDRDFTKMIEAFYDSALEFLTLRGLDGEYKSASELTEAITVTSFRQSEIADGRLNAISKIEVNISMPATLGDLSVGEIIAKLSYTVEIIDGRVKLDLDSDNLALDTDGSLVGRIEFLADASGEYSAEHPLLMRDAEGVYHLPGCKEATDKDGATIPEYLADTKAKSCAECELSSFLASLYVIDGEEYHRLGCGKLIITDKTRFTESIPKDEVTPCPDCEEVAEGISAFRQTFEERLKASEEEDVTEAPKAQSMVVAVFTSDVSGIDSELFEIFMELDFPDIATTDFTAESESKFSFSYRVRDGKIHRFDSISSTSIEGAPGLGIDLSLSICGIEIKYI